MTDPGQETYHMPAHYPLSDSGVDRFSPFSRAYQRLGSLDAAGRQSPKAGVNVYCAAR